MTCRAASAPAKTNAASRASRTRYTACKMSAPKASKAQHSHIRSAIPRLPPYTRPRPHIHRCARSLRGLSAR
jgi:hypothetical protein